MLMEVIARCTQAVSPSILLQARAMLIEVIAHCS
jgi:hypothetical protein